MNPDPLIKDSLGVKKGAGILFLFLAVAFLLYWPSINGPFVFDDVYYILDNPNIALKSLSAEGLLAAAGSGRPLTTLTFALNHLAGGYDTTGFHLVNTAIHAFTAFFFFFLAELTLVLAGRAKNARKAAFLAAFLFLCHPLATQSVCYISQRSNAMCAMFFILSLLLFVRGRMNKSLIVRRLFYAGCMAAGLLALLSKENAATLPFFIFLYEWLFFRKADEKWLKGLALPIIWMILLMAAAGAMAVGRGSVHPGLFAAACLLAPMALYTTIDGRNQIKADSKNRRIYGIIQIALTVSLVFVTLAIWVEAGPWAGIINEYKNIAPITCYQRLLTEARVVFIYLGLYLLPLPNFLSLSHDVVISTSLFSSPGSVAAILAICEALYFAVKARRKKPVLVFAIFMYFGNLAIESSFYPLHLIFEHRAYLPMIFLALPAVSWAMDHFPRRAFLALTLIVIVLGFFSFQRNWVWADDLALWEDAVQKAPENALRTTTWA